MTVEPETAPERDNTLYVSESGSVVRSFHGENPFTLLRKHAVSKRPADLATLLGVEKPGPEGGARTLATSPFRHARVERWSSPRPQRCGCPPGCSCRRRTIKSSRWSSCSSRPDAVRRRRPRAIRPARGARLRSLCARPARPGWRHPRVWQKCRARRPRHNNEEHYSWSALILGKPLLGQGVTDLLAVIRGLGPAGPERSAPCDRGTGHGDRSGPMRGRA